MVDFAIQVDHRVNVKESEKRDKYLDLPRERRKLWKMRVTVILIVIGALGTVPNGLERGLEELKIGSWAEIIQTRAWYKSVKILRRVLRRFAANRIQWSPVNKNLQRVKYERGHGSRKVFRCRKIIRRSNYKLKYLPFISRWYPWERHEYLNFRTV